MSSSIRDVSFLHDSSQLSAALERFLALEPGQALIFAGHAASGRRRVLEWLVERACERGQATRIVPLSLDGFEPTGPGVGRFVEFRSESAGALAPELPEPLHKLVERVQAAPLAASNGRWAIALALILELPEPASLCSELLALEGGALTPERALGGALARHSAEARAIVQVASDTTLSDASADWLFARCREHERVRLAFYSVSQLASEALVSPQREQRAPLRFELGGQLTPEQLDQLLAAKDVAEADRPALAAAARGSVARLGRALEALLLAADSAPARLQGWLAGSGEDPAKLRAVLQLCAACGEVAPILPLLAAGGMSQADAERFIDVIDEGLCGSEAPLPMFDDLAYRHPGFPGLSVYRFRDRALRAALLDTADPAAERALLEFLSTRLALGTRSVAQLFVNLTERTQFEHSAGPRQRLRLWIGPAEQDTLQALLRNDVKAGRLAADALFTTAQRDHSLSVHQRMALLEASIVDEASLPSERRLTCHALRAELLCAAGRFQDALSQAERALALLAEEQPEPAGMRGLLLFLCANCQRQLGRFDLALQSFKDAAAEAARPQADGSVDFHNQGVCLAEAGHCHAERGEWDTAVALLCEGIAHLKKQAGEQRVHPEQLAQLERNLAVCQAKRSAAAGAG